MYSVDYDSADIQWRLVYRHCRTAAPHIFAIYFVFKSVYCYTLIFNFARTRRVDIVCFLPKNFSTKLMLTSICFCMVSTASDETLELWALAAPVSLKPSVERVAACQSSTANLELWFPLRWTGMWQAAESLCWSSCWWEAAYWMVGSKAAMSDPRPS